MMPRTTRTLRLIARELRYRAAHIAPAWRVAGPLGRARLLVYAATMRSNAAARRSR